MLVQGHPVRFMAEWGVEPRALILILKNPMVSLTIRHLCGKRRGWANLGKEVSTETPGFLGWELGFKGST